MKKVTIIAEGAANLRSGFGMLLRKIITNKKIKVLQLGPKAEAIKRFKKYQKNWESSVILLIDLDDTYEQREIHIQNESLASESADVFFMVQEMEAWFISQPNILEELWKEDLFSDYENKQPMQISKPSEELYNRTKKSKYGAYAKGSDGSLLLGMLDAKRLQEDFPDFRKLINRIIKMGA